MKLKLTNAQLIASMGVVIVFITDMFIPLGVAIGALYILCFFIVSQETKKTILIFATVIPVLIIIKFMVFYTSGTSWMAFANRGISIAVVLIVSLLAIKHRKLRDTTNKEITDYILALDLSNHRLQSIQQAMDAHMIISITDTNGSISYVNKNFCDVSKYNRSELIGKNHRIIKSEEHPDEFYKNLWETILAGKPWSGEVKNRAKDGSFYWCNTVIVPYLDNRKKINQFLAIRIPITEKKLLEEKQKKHTQSLEKILHDISHKLKSPIATCLGLTQLMEYQKYPSTDVLDLAIEHRKTCATDLSNFSQEISTYIYQQTERTPTPN